MSPTGNSSTSNAFRPVLLQTGENIFDVAPVLGYEHANLRKKISAAQAWPIAGDWRVKDFRIFPNLPKELRNRIWGFAVAAQQPRVVNIFVVEGKLRCNAITPKIFHTCSESRNEAFLTYHQLVIDGVNTGCYVNFDIDWVFFDTTIPLIKVFGPDPEYPIFQEKCRKLALQSKPLNVYGKTLGRFAKLEELALVTITNDAYPLLGGGGYLGNVNFFSLASFEFSSWWIQSLRRDLEGLVKELAIPVVSVVDVQRVAVSRIMTAAEKERARMKRQKERDVVAPVRADEDLAIRLQYELDQRKVEVEVQEGGLDDGDEEDEFGFGLAMDHGIFSEDFMIYY